MCADHYMENGICFPCAAVSISIAFIVADLVLIVIFILLAFFGSARVMEYCVFTLVMIQSLRSVTPLPSCASGGLSWSLLVGGCAGCCFYLVIS